MDEVQAVEKMIELLEADMKLDDRVKAMDELAAEAEISKAHLVTKAEGVIAKREAKKSLATTELGVTLGEVPKPKISTIMSTDPFVNQAVVTVGSNGQLETPPGAKPGDAYLVALVPIDAKVTIQPPSLMAGGTVRQLMTVEAIYRLGVPVEKSPSTASEESWAQRKGVVVTVDSGASLTPRKPRQRKSRKSPTSDN